MRAAGVMSGTSLDGIDAVYVEITPRRGRLHVETLRHESLPFTEALREWVRAALPPNAPPPAEVARLDAELGAAFGDAVRCAVGAAPLDFVASHGLTLYHDGDARRSVQIGDPYLIRERAEATVAFDFRRADCAAGGQGAPLVPYVDALLFGDDDNTTVALNLGGIANLTLVPPRCSPEPVRGWDTGPGNMLLDAFVRSRTEGRESFDVCGEHARRGTVDAALLQRLLDDPYFVRVPPKSTGREYFGEAFLDARAAEFSRCSLDDGCATLCALTVESVARAIERFGPAEGRVVVSGGGARNRALLEGLRARLAPSLRVAGIAEFGIDPSAKEAIAFAVLGYELLCGRAAGLPSVTGAARPVLLGALAPHGLNDLLARIAVESAELVAL